MYRVRPTTLVRGTTLVQRAVQQPQIASVVRRAATTHAISNPTLANIEKRWEGLPLQEQADLWMALRDRMKGNWKDLTVQEKKAGESRAIYRHSFALVAIGVRLVNEACQAAA